MKILQICSKPPLPNIDGGCKAMHNVTEGLLKNGLEVNVLSLSTAKHPFKEEVFPDEYKEKTSIESIFVDTKPRFSGAFLNLFSSTSYNVIRFYSKQFEGLIVKKLKEHNFDVVFLEGLYVTSYIEIIAKNFKGKIIYRSHNVEYEIWERNAANEKNNVKKWYLNLLARRLKNYELSILNEVDGVAAISEKDRLTLIHMGCNKPIEVFPFGINIEKYKKQKGSDNLNFFHIGSMDWLPNQEGIKWFLENVWNQIIDVFPEAKLNLAGKGMPSWMLNWKQKNVQILGQVDDAIEFINENEVMIVPLFSGSGMRIKVIEGMALGKTVIATTIAAEGIKYEADKNILIANTAEEYIYKMTKCLSDKEFSLRLGDEAKKMIQANYDNQHIVNNLVQFLEKIS